MLTTVCKFLPAAFVSLVKKHHSCWYRYTRFYVQQRVIQFELFCVWAKFGSNIDAVMSAAMHVTIMGRLALGT
jgi:hypothetical protein